MGSSSQPFIPYVQAHKYILLFYSNSRRQQRLARESRSAQEGFRLSGKLTSRL